jgi:decaprenylphospho-beta-D-ribofuranose 2-oxidase
MRLSGWGRFPVADCTIERSRSVDDVRSSVGDGELIARGNGRAYGDSALNPAGTLSMLRLNRMLEFDDVSGQLVAEAGVMLSDVIDVFLPRGWFPAVTPGTRHVTLGGMIAADVHGKNHHIDGSMRNFIDWIELVRADGVAVRCSREIEPELFEWTIGGMGLTGVIVRAAIRLRPVETAWIRQTTIPAPDLDAAFAAFEGSLHAAYSVAWIDCLASGRDLGRSLVTLGEHAELDDLPEGRRAAPLVAPPSSQRAVPFELPSQLLNRLSVGMFNRAHYWNGRRSTGTRLVPWDAFFYPLDAVADWNRIYGKGGFAQYQCLIPLERARAGVEQLLALIAKAGMGSFLAVLKRFGNGGGGFSFPAPGYTLALDFPVSSRALTLFDALDRVVLEHGGRQYLAKDSRMGAETLALSDPRTEGFRAFRQASSAKDAFRSLQSERLNL